MKLLSGVQVVEIEALYESARLTVQNGRKISDGTVLDLLRAMDELIGDHHELRQRMTRATMSLDGRVHGGDIPDSLLDPA